MKSISGIGLFSTTVSFGLSLDIDELDELPLPPTVSGKNESHDIASTLVVVLLPPPPPSVLPATAELDERSSRFRMNPSRLKIDCYARLISGLAAMR
jgi:hypothetical protein